MSGVADTPDTPDTADLADLTERIRSPGYTPARRDVGRLLDLLAGATEEVAKLAVRALARLGDAVVPRVMQRFDEATGPGRARLVALVGRVASESDDTSLTPWLVARLADADPVAKRRAITALGKIGGPSLEGALLDAWEQGLAPPELRALVVALGNLGQERALARLSRLEHPSRDGTGGPHDAELARVVAEARTKIERSLLRREGSAIDASATLSGPVPILLHVRAGLEEILQGELGREARSRVVGPGRVEVSSSGPLEQLFRARTFLHLGFPLPPERVEDGDTVAAVVRALSSDAAWEILSRLGRTPVRYRLEWAEKGRRKGATFHVAERVQAIRPDLVNDPTRAPWEAVVTEREASARVGPARSGGGRAPGGRDARDGRRVFVELWPRGLSDPRFSYRTRTLPASSHPTIAAALAHVAGVVPSDVVWDPFVGSGIELCERALLGPYAKLFGSDVDEGALAAARENLANAGALRFTIAPGDARTHRPPAAPSLIITNPPFGRRVLERDALLPLFERFFANAAGVLSASGRLVWVSPLPDATVALAEAQGLVVRVRCPVDVGGVPGEIQLFVRGAGRPAPRPRAEPGR